MENMNVVNSVNFNEIGMEEKKMMNEEVKAQENVVVANEEEKEMDVMENAQAQEEVKQEEVQTVRRFCTQCGKPMDIPVGSRISVCDECREARKAENARLAHEKAARRKAEKNLVTMNVTLNADTKDDMKALAKAKGVSIADLLKELVDKAKAEIVLTEENEQEIA